jgi:transcriptional regulator GlxA family with amidase domain
MEPSTATVPRSLQRALAFAHANLSAPLPLQQLAAVASMSLCRFTLMFRHHMGMPPRRYICRQRVRHAKALLRQGIPAVSVADACGFYDQSHLSRHFKNVCGMTPGEYLRRVAPPADVRDAVAPIAETAFASHHPVLASRTEPHRVCSRRRSTAPKTPLPCPNP